MSMTIRNAAGALVALILLAGCGGAAAPSIAPGQTGSAAASALAAQASRAASAAASPSAASSATSWEQVVTAAKREGSVVLAAQAGAGAAESLTTAFKAKFPDIRVDYTGDNGNVLETKILTERQAGKYNWDLMIHGPPNLVDLLPQGVFEPIDAYLGGPDEDASKWNNGRFDFSDDAGKYVLLMTGGVATPAIYNPQLVQSGEITSYKDLLTPRWKGKLAMLDPRIPGNAQGLTQFWSLVPSLGRDFIKDFFAQGAVVSKEDRQLTDWVAKGQYAIGVGANGFEAIQMRKNGVPLEFLSGNDLKESGYLTASWGSVGVINKAPHPNAARVYLNWLLSNEGQDALVKAAGYASRRLDVSKAGLLEATIPQSGRQYIEITKETYVKQRPQLVEYVKTLIDS